MSNVLKHKFIPNKVAIRAVASKTADVLLVTRFKDVGGIERAALVASIGAGIMEYFDAASECNEFIEVKTYV